MDKKDIQNFKIQELWDNSYDKIYDNLKKAKK